MLILKLITVEGVFQNITHLNGFSKKTEHMEQCSGSITFWSGSGSADPCLWLMVPDPDKKNKGLDPEMPCKIGVCGPDACMRSFCLKEFS